MDIINKWSDDIYDYVQYANGTLVQTAKSMPIVQTLDEVKQQKIKDLQQSYYGSFTTFQSSATGTAKTYPIDIEAQKNLSDYQNRLIADTNKDAFYFKTIEDGTLILHNRVQFLQLMEDAEQFKVNQTIKYNSLVNQVNAATTTDEVDAVTW